MMNRATTPVRDRLAREATVALAAAADRAARDREQYAAEYGVSDAKLALMQVLDCCADGQACLFALSEQLGVTRPNVTKLVDGLERSGLVERRPHPADGRMVQAHLTPDGTDLAHDALPGRAEHMERVWDALDDEELALLTALLSRLAPAEEPAPASAT
jgi:DNA-binding MarR family transcriptional regulator